MMDLEKTSLLPYSSASEEKRGPRPRCQFRGRRGMGSRRLRALRFFVIACLAFIAYAQWKQTRPSHPGPSKPTTILSRERLLDNLATCKKLRHTPEDPIGLGREKNARYIDGHKPTLIRDATVWVGEPSEGTSAEDAHLGKGYSWITSDVFLEHGLIKQVSPDIVVSSLPKDTQVWDAKGRLLTAGLVDMHNHAGVYSLPGLKGNSDGNEFEENITPFVRSIDGIAVFDQAFETIKSGGVTTSLILPGSANNMGGEAYVIKNAVGKKSGRGELGVLDLLADPERNWRYMKMACGENAKIVHGGLGHGPTSRLGEAWAFRHAFEQAAELVRRQDDWCDAAESVGVESVSDYLPQELKWESLGALLRGQVHLNTHCYTVQDLESFVGYTNEFKFKIRAFHHAHETYLVPEILKRAYGGFPPASALFADNMYYKAESYHGSPSAGRILWENGLTPVYVSDHPVLNSQHVVFEAAKAYHYGLPYHVALASVTSAPAEYLGLGQRLGKVKPGYDADIVVWDSDPLSVGATPVQVWIDGTAQIKDPVELEKPTSKPMSPNESLGKTVGEPEDLRDVVFTGISRVLFSKESATAIGGNITVAISNGKIVCAGKCSTELQAASQSGTKIIGLENGFLTKSFTVFGSSLGLNAIDNEELTENGQAPVTVSDGSIKYGFSRAVDGLALDTKKLHVAASSGVARAISAPKLSREVTHLGTSVGFRTSALHPAIKGAVWGDDVALHYTLSLLLKVSPSTPSYSVAVGALRKGLLDAVLSDKKAEPFSEAAYLKKVVAGKMPLALTVHSADTIAAILRVKKEVESAAAALSSAAPPLRIILIGGAEAHLVADALADASVGVVLTPLQSYAGEWDERRALPGAPLTNGTCIDKLIAAGVTVAIGLEVDSLARSLHLLAGTVFKNGQGKLDEVEALDLISTNVYKILGIGEEDRGENFVVWEGDPLEVGSRVVGVGNGLMATKVFV